MSDYRARLFLEHGELYQNVEKLKAFILAPLFDKLPEVDRKDLKEQLTHMQGYFDVISRRVSRQCNNA